MNRPRLTVIEASAGTGKTFALVTHLLNLIFAGTPSERIVALTFSRLAAGEIFNSFIERLSDAAVSAEKAAAESARLGRNLTQADFTAKLREVIASQHLSLIGTLDSFLMRIVRMMPLELGLEGEISVMSDVRTPIERVRILGEMLMRENTETKEIFSSAFRLAFGSVGAKKFLNGFSDFITNWHRTYLDVCCALREEDPEKILAAWGNADTIWEVPPPGLGVTLAEIRARAADFAALADKRGVGTFIEKVRTFGGTIPSVPKAVEDLPQTHEVVRLMCAWKMADALAKTQGIYLLMSAYEHVYASKIRARGWVTFDDMPRLLSSLPFGMRQNLEYRMDAKFDHWALDEFQDTSTAQWNALQNLTEEILQNDAGRSLFVVGDRKQAIYEWRGGDVSILARLVEEAKKPGNCFATLDESWRYVSVISDAVNRVFDEGTIRGALDMDDAPEGARWACRPHKSHDTETEGFVEVIQAQKKKAKATIEDFFLPIGNALNAVRPWERGITTAILVRKNAVGEAILAHLKAIGISQVVFEGDSSVNDSPVLTAMTELVYLAEHADDPYAYAHIRYSPLAEALYPQGLPDAATLSAQLLDMFTRQGLVRTFRAVREKLKAVRNSWNEFTESRFADFIKCAVSFEETREADMRLSSFAQHLQNMRRRDFAEPGKIRIMTMHQSKGLGFDWVIMPCFEYETLENGQHVGMLEHEDPIWILENPGTGVDAQDEVLNAAERRRRQTQVYGSLCLDYVAMTRAKRALTLILHPENKTKPETPERFSDLVRLVELKTMGDSAWYKKMNAGKDGNPPPPVTQKLENSKTRKLESFRRPKRQTVRKNRPSEHFYAGLQGDVLFGEDFGAAAERGIEIHAQYAQIEWLPSTGGDPRAARFAVAFVKPSPEATVWREKSYEILNGGTWETGQFDRVVFTGTGENRRAVIYDFKTNARRAEESPADFAERMKRTYAPQMRAYQNALHVLTQIPPDRISTCLLLESTGACVSQAKL